MAKLALKRIRELAAGVPELADLDEDRLDKVVRWAQEQEDVELALEHAADEIAQEKEHAPSPDPDPEEDLAPGMRWVTIRVPFVEPDRVLSAPKQVEFNTHKAPELKRVLQGILKAALLQERRLECGTQVKAFSTAVRWMLEQATIE